MKELKTLEFELRETEKQIEDLLLRIKQLRKEVRDITPPEDNKLVHERIVLDKNNHGDYINLNSYFLLPHDNIKVINYVRYPFGTEKYTYYNERVLFLSSRTVKKEIILTYIPSLNLVIVVEI